jgi:hypothetical protein
VIIPLIFEEFLIVLFLHILGVLLLMWVLIRPKEPSYPFRVLIVKMIGRSPSLLIAAQGSALSERAVLPQVIFVPEDLTQLDPPASSVTALGKV